MISAFFQMSRLRTWQSKIAVSCILTSNHFLSPFPSSRAWSHVNGEMLSNGGRYNWASKLVFEDASVSAALGGRASLNWWLLEPESKLFHIEPAFCRCSAIAVNNSANVWLDYVPRWCWCCSLACSRAMTAALVSSALFELNESGPTKVSVVRPMGALIPSASISGPPPPAPA